jgi:hypothetical protein
LPAFQTYISSLTQIANSLGEDPLSINRSTCGKVFRDHHMIPGESR